MDWHSLLAELGALLLEDPDQAACLPPDLLEAGSLSAPGASEQQIAAAEARLGVRFPPSYRAFLAASNGWGASNGSAGPLCSTEQVEWYATHHQELIDAWVAGAGPDDDDDDLDSGSFPASHLQSALAVSEDEDGVILLDPRRLAPDGEWEAWFLASWIPGARRYRSFGELMQRALADLQWTRAYQQGQPAPFADPQLGVDARDFDGLVAALGSPETRRRSLAAESLGLLRDPRAFEPLLARFQDPLEDLFVRESAARALGALRDPRAIAPLRAALEAPAPSAAQIPLSTMLGNLPSDASVDPQTLAALGSLSLADFAAQLGQILGPDIISMIGASEHFAERAAQGMQEHLHAAIRQALLELETSAS
jgi:cell wall assembly regulator SMI1